MGESIQHRRCIARRVYGDRHKLHISLAAQRLLNRMHTRAHEGARRGTVRVNEIRNPHLAGQFLAVETMPLRIGHAERRYSSVIMKLARAVRTREGKQKERKGKSAENSSPRTHSRTGTSPISTYSPGRYTTEVNSTLRARSFVRSSETRTPE